jgi:hypothetical protein
MCADTDGETFDYKFRCDGVSSAAMQKCELRIIAIGEILRTIRINGTPSSAGKNDRNDFWLQYRCETR